jgi:alcohol dehydrogenase class IV
MLAASSLMPRVSTPIACATRAKRATAFGRYLAGMAFNSAGLGLVHALAHQPGATHNLPHGVCTSMLAASSLMPRVSTPIACATRAKRATAFGRLKSRAEQTRRDPPGLQPAWRQQSRYRRLAGQSAGRPSLMPRVSTPIACATRAKRATAFGRLKFSMIGSRMLQAREQMAFGQYLAGMAFNSAGLGLVHALAHQPGAPAPRGQSAPPRSGG